MKEIELTRGKVAIVDNADFETFNGFSWHCTARGYAMRTDNVAKKTYYLHREILKPEKGLVTDHINGNKLDNRRCNLRAVSQQKNCWNKTVGCGEVSYLGVSINGKNFIAKIYVSGKRICLGTFPTPELAHEAYLAAKKIHHVI